MNRETARQLINIVEQGLCSKEYGIADHWELIKKFADGVKIQVETYNGWTDVEEPDFEEGYCYRVKPEPSNRWRAKEGETYYRVDMLLGKAITNLFKEEFNEFDDENFENGNYFKKYEEAQLVAEKISEIFALIREGVPASEIEVKQIEKH